MTSIDSDDDLKALWQTTRPRLKPAEIRASVLRGVRLQQRYVWASHAFGAVVLAYIGFLDLQGVFQWPGLMSAIVGGSMIVTAWKARQARMRCPDLAQLSPEDLLRLGLRHARAALRNARFCHTGLPIAVIAGMAAGPLLVVEGADAGEPKWVSAAWIAVALSFVGGFIVFGLVVARRKKREIGVLQERLREFEESS